MIADGVLEDPRPDAVFGIHLWTALPLGTVGAAAGPQMAAVDEFRIQVEGPGGHAASPHETRDTVVAAAAVVTALQSITSRRLSPLQAAVVTVSSIHGGAAFNVIPDRVILTGTCRGFDREVIERLPGLVESVASAAAATAGCRATTTYRRTNGAVVNDAAEAARCLRLATEAAGATGVAHDVRTMGGEDFCEFLAHAPGAFAFVGAAKAGHGLGPAHHAPDFDFDERALPIAARLYAAYARDLLDVPRPAV